VVADMSIVFHTTKLTPFFIMWGYTHIMKYYFVALTN
jgi:hypothetical protein